jgi:hypothetical protein
MTRCAVCENPFKIKKLPSGEIVNDDPSMVAFYDGDRKKQMYRHLSCKQSDFITKKAREDAAIAKEV